jgi:hypothetical protein
VVLQWVWLCAALVLFKFVVLQGGPGFTKEVLTGAHGSVQFSTVAEVLALALCGIGAGRWARKASRLWRRVAS